MNAKSDYKTACHAHRIIIHSMKNPQDDASEPNIRAARALLSLIKDDILKAAYETMKDRIEEIKPPKN